jgi:DNA repair exonuclease SbcCD ATPase subunit
MKCTIKDIVDFYNEYPEHIADLLVETRFGYKEIEYADITAFNSDVYLLITNTGKEIMCSPKHKFLSNNSWKYTKDFKINDVIETKDGQEHVKSISLLDQKLDLYDLQVADVHEFYANDIVSHNSTILDSICFALYGRPYRKINKPQLVNAINKKNLVVEIEFTIGSYEYLVRRGMKPNKFEIIRDGELINVSADVRDYQSILETQILRLNYKSFCQIIIQGKNASVPFMQLTAQNRREVVEDILDLQIFSVMNTILKSKVTDNNSEINHNEYAIDLIKEKIAMQRQHSLVLRDNLNEQILRIEDEISDNQKSIANFTANISDLNNRVYQLSKDIEDQNKIEKKKGSLQKIHYQLNEKLKSIRCDSEFFENHKDCPTCRQAIDDEFRSHVLVERKQQSEQVIVGIDELESRLQEVFDREKEITEINKKITSYNLSIFADQNSITGLQNHNNKLYSDIEELKQKIISQETSNDIELLNKEYEELLNRQERLIEQKEHYGMVAHILKDTGIKSKILKQYIPIINKLINKYLAAMEFFVEFHIDENFNETIKSRYRDDFTYMSFSEGEKARIDLAIVLTWRSIARMRNSASTNLFILDEILDGSLDAQGFDDLIRIIQRELKDTNTFLISHKVEQISDKFNNVIEFVKTGNFSRIKT